MMWVVFLWLHLFFGFGMCQNELVQQLSFHICVANTINFFTLFLLHELSFYNGDEICNLHLGLDQWVCLVLGSWYCLGVGSAGMFSWWVQLVGLFGLYL